MCAKDISLNTVNAGYDARRVYSSCTPEYQRETDNNNSHGERVPMTAK